MTKNNNGRLVLLFLANLALVGCGRSDQVALGSLDEASRSSTLLPFFTKTKSQATQAGLLSCTDLQGILQDCSKAASQATVAQANYAFWQTIAAFLGLSVGVGTLAAALWAGRSAKLAAVHTEAGAREARRGADAAEESLEQVRSQAHVQLRPYIAVKLVDLRIDRLPESRIPTEISVNYSVEFTNVGTTPAYVFKTGANIKEIASPYLDNDPPIGIDVIEMTDFGTVPGSTPITIRFSKNVSFNVENQLSGSARICLAVTAEYQGILSQDVYTISHYVVLANMPEVLNSFWNKGAGTISTVQEVLPLWTKAT